MPFGATSAQASLPTTRPGSGARRTPAPTPTRRSARPRACPCGRRTPGTSSAISGSRLSWRGGSPRCDAALEMDVLQDQARREGAHDRRQARPQGQVGQQEAEAERERQHHAARAERRAPPGRAAARGTSRRTGRPPGTANALTTIRAIAPADSASPVAAPGMMPDTTASTSSPSTSSITAAPRMMRAKRRAQRARVLQHPRGDADAGRGQHGAQESVQHPGLVGSHELSDAEAEEHRRDDAHDGHARRRPPTASISLGVDSRPTWKSSRTAPSSAITVKVSLVSRAERSGPPSSAALPSSDARRAARRGRPAGPSRSTSSPASFAATRTKASAEQDDGYGIGAVASAGSRQRQQVVHASSATEHHPSLSARTGDVRRSDGAPGRRIVLRAGSGGGGPAHGHDRAVGPGPDHRWADLTARALRPWAGLYSAG